MGDPHKETRAALWRALKTDDPAALRRAIGQLDPTQLTSEQLWNPRRPARFKKFQSLLEICARNGFQDCEPGVQRDGPVKCAALLVAGWVWPDIQVSWALRFARLKDRNAIESAVSEAYPLVQPARLRREGP